MSITKQEQKCRRISLLLKSFFKVLQCKPCHDYLPFSSLFFLITCCFILSICIESIYAENFITGRIYDMGGQPAEEVIVYSYRADLKNTRSTNLSKYAEQHVKSNHLGMYTITLDTAVATTIIGKKNDLWFYRTISPESNAKLIDTLKECGNLRFYLNLEKSNRHDLVDVSLIGTPFSAKSDKVGAVNFNCISPGNYQAILNSSRPGYQTVLCSLRIAAHEYDTFPDTLIIPYIGINTISFTKTSYDTSKNIVYLNWDSNVPKATEYVIKRTIKTASKPNEIYATTKDLFFTDTLMSHHSLAQNDSLISKKQLTISYIVTAKGKRSLIESATDTTQFTIPSLKKIDTIDTNTTAPQNSTVDSAVAPINDEPPIVHAGNDTTVGIRDTIFLNGTAEAKNGEIILWEWSIDNSPFVTFPDGSHAITAPLKTSTLTAILRVTANNGKQATDTVHIQVNSSPPEVIAEGDSIAGIFDTIQLSGTAKDNGSILSMGWDIGNKGNFSVTSDGKTLLLPDGAPKESLLCIFRAIDDDGETGFDTLVVHRRIRWKVMTPSPEIPERKGHALLNFNGMLWIIGGNFSDIWNSSDGIHWQQVIESAPFGERFGHSATAFNGQIFVIGGKGPDDSYTNSIWSSFNGKTWNKLVEADFLKRNYHSVTQFKNRLWIIGGLGESGYEACLNDIWSSEDGKTWKIERDTSSFPRRYGHGAVVLNDTLIITGGLYEGFNGTQTLYDTWSSPDGITWNNINDSPALNKKEFFSFLGHKNQIWSFGGYCISCQKDSSFKNINTTANGSSWQAHKVDHQTTSSIFSAGVVFNDKIFMSPADTPYLLMLQ